MNRRYWTAWSNCKPKAPNANPDWKNTKVNRKSSLSIAKSCGPSCKFCDCPNKNSKEWKTKPKKKNKNGRRSSKLGDKSRLDNARGRSGLKSNLIGETKKRSRLKGGSICIRNWKIRWNGEGNKLCRWKNVVQCVSEIRDLSKRNPTKKLRKKLSWCF